MLMYNYRLIHSLKTPANISCIIRKEKGEEEEIGLQNIMI